MRPSNFRVLSSLSVAFAVVFLITRQSLFFQNTTNVLTSILPSTEGQKALIPECKEWSSSTQASVSLQQWQLDQNAGEEFRALQNLNLTDELEYRHLCISTTARHGINRSSIYESGEEFFRNAPAHIVSKPHLSDDHIPACHTYLRLDVPTWTHLNAIDTSILMLGMSTTLSRFNSSLSAISQWLSGTDTILQVLLTDDVDGEELQPGIDELSVSIAASDMVVAFHVQRFAYESEGLKNFALANVLHHHKSANTRWLGVIDDDTFFVSVHQLVLALNSYNSTQMMYIGALSEGLSRIAKEGFKAWGGAGFFLSTSLMAIVAAHAEECQALDQGFGDLLWRDCIVEYTSPTVQLTQLKGLNQIDMWKDVSGWYESAHDPLYTVHHWKSWHYHPVPSMHLVTKVAGPDVLFQRYRFTDDTVLYNGYSFVYYPQGLPDLDRTELTMVEDVGIDRFPQQNEFLHSMGKTRQAMEIGKTKIQWKLETSTYHASTMVSQIYVKRADANQGMNIDSVIQIDWHKS